MPGQQTCGPCHLRASHTQQQQTAVNKELTTSEARPFCTSYPFSNQSRGPHRALPSKMFQVFLAPRLSRAWLLFSMIAGICGRPFCSLRSCSGCQTADHASSCLQNAARKMAITCLHSPYSTTACPCSLHRSCKAIQRWSIRVR